MRKRICLSISILAVSLLAPCQAGAQQARETASADSIRLFEGVSVGVDSVSYTHLRAHET